MGKRRFRLKLSCVSIARVLSAPSLGSNSSSSSSASIKYGDMSEFPSMSQEHSSCNNQNGDNNKIMVVVNSSFEAKCALDWALSHAVQSQDTLLLLQILKPSSQGREGGERVKMKRQKLVEEMKKMCQMKRGGVCVRVVEVEGEEEGKAIVEEAEQQRVSLLVIGKRKKRSLWRGLVRRLWGRKKREKEKGATTCNGVADYCIHNASCMTIAVRRKNKKLGGYLITTKRHKNFWLLA